MPIKLSILLSLFSIILLSQMEAQTSERKDAADAINFIDSLTNPLKPSANNLVAYFRKLSATATSLNDYMLPNEQIDSLQNYFSILIAEYDKAIRKTKQNKTIVKFLGLKINFLKLLDEGRKPWATIIPAHIKMFINGKTSLSIIEKNLISKRSLIFKNSAEKTLEWAKIVALQEENIEKKYHLKLIDELYN